MLTLRPRVRDCLLTLAGVAGLVWLFSLRASEDPSRGARALGELTSYAALWRAGHLPGASLVGLLCALSSALGLLGLLGDSPLDLQGDERPVAAPTARASWLAALAAVLYLAGAGSFGLWDPWETHYGEVAREMLSRDDWITLWWGPEGWFMSKPGLLPGIVALGLSAGSLFGTSFLPGVHLHAQEWFVRAPVVLLSLAALASVHRTVRSIVGPRAGVWSALVLATTPFWALVSHQAMTDMPFVALMTLAMTALLRALTAGPTQLVEARVFRLGFVRLRLSQWHLVVGLVALVAVPQALYLLTRPVLLACGDDGGAACEAALRAARLGPVQLPVERFFAGSAYNSGLSVAASVPGTHVWSARFSAAPWLPSFAQGAVWLGVLALVLRSLRGERTLQGLSFALVYLYGGLSFLAKGPAGLGVPEVVLALFVLAHRRWSVLKRLRLARGVGVFLLCAGPWYVAISARLGHEYFERFVVHDILNRSLSGVHGDQGAAGYYLQQLAYGLFPWGALLPLGLFRAGSLDQTSGDEASAARATALALVRLWFGVALALFSLMATRFHHYILPAVPAAAILVGTTLAELFDGSPDREAALSSRRALLLGAMLTALVTRELWLAPTGPGRFAQLFTYNYTRALPPLAQGFRPALLAFGVLSSAALVWAAAKGLSKGPAVLLGATALASTAWTLFVYMPALSPHRSQRALFERYELERRGEQAPLGAYALNWKGENFYSGNSIAQFECAFASCPSGRIEAWLRDRPERRLFVLTEHSRLATLRAYASRAGRSTRRVTSEEDNSHFALVEVSR